MGWWWSDAEKPQPLPKPSQMDTSFPAQSTSPPPYDATFPLAPSTESQPSSDPDPQPAIPRNRDEQAFSDLKDLFTQIDPERSARASTAARDYAAQKPEFDPDSLYPSEMSCSSCFDLAYYCSSLGGQLNNVYQYGGLRSCTEQWAQWRFCMRTKAMSEDTRRLKIREWNQRKAARFKLGKSSEDVWEVRKVPMEGALVKSVDEYKS